MMVKKTKSNSLKKVGTLALANLLLVGAHLLTIVPKPNLRKMILI